MASIFHSSNIIGQSLLTVIWDFCYYYWLQKVMSSFILCKPNHCYCSGLRLLFFLPRWLFNRCVLVKTGTLNISSPLLLWSSLLFLLWSSTWYKKFVKIIKTFTMKIALLGWDGTFLSSVLFTHNFSFIKNS